MPSPARGTPRTLDDLYAAAEETLAGPGFAAQVALAQGSRLLGSRAFGRARFGGAEAPATSRSLFALFSVTKAITASASWILLQEGKLRLSDRVADLVPGFGANGKQAVTVEHLLTHTAGLPSATLDSRDSLDPGHRRARFAEWELEWEPGSRFTYHPSSSFWLLAEVISQVAATDYRAFIRGRVLERLGLEDLFVGLPAAQHGRVAEVVPWGEPMSPDARAVAPVDAPALDDETATWVNRPEARSLGSPGGGAIGTATDVARFYQGLLADAAGSGTGIWTREMLESAFTPRNPDFVDPMTGRPALRGLGVVVAGEADRIWRGFAEGCSPRSIGHMGAGGQVAWADPDSGACFGYCTNAADRNPLRQGARSLQLSNLASRIVAV